MDVRDMRRTDWHRILEREYSARDFEYCGARARECLMLIKKAKESLDVGCGSFEVRVVDNGYYWLQTAVEDAKVWLTAMFDAEGRFLQIYFDITAGNRFDDPENPTFEDMYLDVVLTPKGEIYVLDEDELDEALSCGKIVGVEYERAKEACKKLCEWLDEHSGETVEYCKDAFERLKGGM